MKKILTGLCALCLLLSCILVGCGNGYAKVTGIYASVVMPDENDPYSANLQDNDTSIENDYILQVDKTYNLAITFVASGGSRYPLIDVNYIKLYYDHEALQIKRVSENFSEVLHYELICKNKVDNTAVIVEYKDKSDKYGYAVIISSYAP